MDAIALGYDSPVRLTQGNEHRVHPRDIANILARLRENGLIAWEKGDIRGRFGKLILTKAGEEVMGYGSE